MLLGLIAPLAAEAREPEAVMATRPTPGTRGAALAKLLQHPSLDPGHGTTWSPQDRTDFVRSVFHEYHRVGARPSRSRAARADLLWCWRELLPALEKEFGQTVRPRLHLIAEPGAQPNAQALPDRSILVDRSYLELARSIAGAVASAGTEDRPLMLRNLATVALAARRRCFTVPFPGAEKKAPELYRETYRGVLAGVVGHELGHVIGDHQAIDFGGGSRSVLRPRALEEALAGYFPARVVRRNGLQGIVERRGTVFHHAKELDADRVAVDLVVGAGLSPLGLLADQLVTAMMNGLRAEPTPRKSHPPGLVRFQDSFARLLAEGAAPWSEPVSRAALDRALREARGLAGGEGR